MRPFSSKFSEKQYCSLTLYLKIFFLFGTLIICWHKVTRTRILTIENIFPHKWPFYSKVLDSILSLSISPYLFYSNVLQRYRNRMYFMQFLNWNSLLFQYTLAFVQWVDEHSSFICFAFLLMENHLGENFITIMTYPNPYFIIDSKNNETIIIFNWFKLFACTLFGHSQTLDSNPLTCVYPWWDIWYVVLPCSD